MKEEHIKKAIENLRRAATEVRRAQGNLNKADRHNMALLKLATEIEKQVEKTEAMLPKEAEIEEMKTETGESEVANNEGTALC
jgi:hypothetical protein